MKLNIASFIPNIPQINNILPDTVSYANNRELISKGNIQNYITDYSLVLLENHMSIYYVNYKPT